MSDQWRTMDTAPKDYQRIECVVGFTTMILQRCGCGDPDCGWHDDDDIYFTPTAWRPLTHAT